MKTKRLISVLMTVVMMLSVVFCIIPSASADTAATKVNKVYSCKNVTQIANYFQQGSFSFKDTTSGSGDWSKVYSFTITDDAYVGVNFAFSRQSEYDKFYKKDECKCEVYYDPYCSSKVDMEKSEYNDNAYFGKLAKGTYYVKASTNFNKTEDFVFLVGRVSKNTQFQKLSIVKNQGKSTTFRLSTLDEVKECWVDSCNYGSQSFLTTKVCGDKIELHNNQFSHTFSNLSEFSMDKYINVAYIDVNGFSHKTYALCMTPYMTKVTGVVNKQYTGRSITQKPVVTVDTQNASYYISYKNNKNVGTATMTITGKGDTIGTITKTFKINPANISKGSSSVKGKYATLKWGSSKGASAYRVQKLVGKTWKNVKNTKVNKLKVSVGKGKTKFRVCGYKKVGKTTYYSANRGIVVNRKK